MRKRVGSPSARNARSNLRSPGPWPLTSMTTQVTPGSEVAKLSGREKTGGAGVRARPSFEADAAGTVQTDAPLDLHHLLRRGAPLELPSSDGHRVPDRHRGLEDPDQLDLAAAPGGHLQVRLEPAARLLRQATDLALGVADRARPRDVRGRRDRAQPQPDGVLDGRGGAVDRPRHARHRLRRFLPAGARPARAGAL